MWAILRRSQYLDNIVSNDRMVDDLTRILEGSGLAFVKKKLQKLSHCHVNPSDRIIVVFQESTECFIQDVLKSTILEENTSRCYSLEVSM